MHKVSVVGYNPNQKYNIHLVLRPPKIHLTICNQWCTHILPDSLACHKFMTSIADFVGMFVYFCQR